MAQRMKPLPKFLLILTVVLAVIFGGRWLISQPWAKKSPVVAAAAPGAKVNGPRKFKDAKPINVGVVTWGGYAGGEFFNGGFKASEQSRFWTDYRLAVNFIVIDDYAASRQAFKAGKVDLLWNTADAFPTEVESMAEFDPRICFQSDWSRGGDAIVAIRSIHNVADLRGKKVAVAYGTPSHTLLMYVLKSGGMTINDIIPVEEASAIDAATAFKSGNCDAAVVWSPDDDDCVNSVTGAHVLVNTKTASNIIADVFYARHQWINDHQSELWALYEGWMRGAAEINSSPSAKQQAAQILADGLNQPVSYTLNAINNVRLTTHGDNLNFFGLNPNYRGVTGDELYTKTGAMYAALNPPLAPRALPAWRTVIDLSAIRAAGSNLMGSEQAAEEAMRFAQATREEASAPALSSRAITVNFPTGSAVLSDDAKSIIDTNVADVARTLSGARVRIEGNTDNIGSPEFNRDLSRRRAEAVANYLVSTYGFDRYRFTVIGNGPDKPVADNGTDAGRAANRRTDFELLAR